MTKHMEADGTEVQVDTIFFNFKKGVFKYLRLETDITTFTVYGAYNESDNTLSIDVDMDTTEDWQCDESCLQWDGEVSRIYQVEKRKSSEMVLVYKDEKYVFRKY